MTGIKNIKFNAWEPLIINQIEKIRTKEKNLVIKIFAIKGLGDAFSKMVPTVALVVIIWVYNALHDVHLTVAETFYVITILGLLVRPFSLMVFAFMTVTSARVSFDRIH